MKHTLLCCVLGLVVLSGNCMAQEYELIGLGTRIQGLVDVTAQSKYVWRGFDWFNSRAATQLTAGVDLPEIGTGFLVSGHMAMGRGYESRERWDYSFYYRNTLATGELYETRYRLGWVYYNHPALPARQNDLQEGYGVVSFPKITGVKGLIPSYVLIKMWPAQGGGLVNTAGYADGWMHVINLDYVFSVPGALPELPEQVVKLHSEITYNDGLNPVDGVPVEAGFSHVVVGGSTDYELGYGFSLTPAVFYQVSLEDTVNPEDQLWGTLGLRYQF